MPPSMRWSRIRWAHSVGTWVPTVWKESAAQDYPDEDGNGFEGVAVPVCVWLLQLVALPWLNGLVGRLQRWVVGRTSPVEYMNRWKLRRKLKRLYGEIAEGGH